LRRDAVWALAQIGGRAWDLLAAELRNGDAVARRILIDAIVYIGETRGCRLFVTALGDPDVKVRRRAVYALEWCDMPEAIPPLIAALRDADPDVAASAASVLQIKQCREALPELRWVAKHDMRRTIAGTTVAARAHQAVRAIERD
jgi:HEAT repeat protein